jgi:hypothetical protein
MCELPAAQHYLGKFGSAPVPQGGPNERSLVTPVLAGTRSHGFNKDKYRCEKRNSLAFVLTVPLLLLIVFVFRTLALVVFIPIVRAPALALVVLFFVLAILALAVSSPTRQTHHRNSKSLTAASKSDGVPIDYVIKCSSIHAQFVVLGST